MEAKIFKVHSIGPSGVNTTWANSLDSSRSCQPISMAIPPEFEGPGGTYSPEDLYILSLLNCYLATFKYVASKSKLDFNEIEGHGTLFVEKGEEKSLWMKKAVLKFHLKGVKQLERSLNLMEKTKNNCMIINSVKTEVEFIFTASEN